MASSHFSENLSSIPTADSGYGHNRITDPVVEDPEKLSFNIQENHTEIVSGDIKIVPSLEATIRKGFFRNKDGVSTCYRRNYIAVDVSYTLHPWISQADLYLDRKNAEQEQIQSLAVSVSAASNDNAGKSIELFQYTTKRLKGPQISMQKELLSPTAPETSQGHGPRLPLQNPSEFSPQHSDTSHRGSVHQHVFERIQFKSATANNGKGVQKYYHLIINLWANIQGSRDMEANWVKLVSRRSQPVIVLGRVRHSLRENPCKVGASRGTIGSSLGGFGHPGLGSQGTQASGPYKTYLSNNYATAAGSPYPGTAYTRSTSCTGGFRVNLANCLSGDLFESPVGDQYVLHNNTNAYQPHQDYPYDPAPPNGITSPNFEYWLPQPQCIIQDEFLGLGALAAGW